MLTRIRRGALQKEAGGNVDKAEGNKCETKAVTRSSRRASEDRKGKAKSKVDVEANSSMPTYSFAEYCDPSPTVVYIRCEDEANTLVQTLERCVHYLPYRNGSTPVPTNDVTVIVP
jgi:hypothetical protein